jgi:hypothetical protein
MSYEMVLTVRPANRYSSPLLATHQSVGQHLLTGLGQAASLIRLADQLDEAVVAYNAVTEDHFAAHQSVLNTVANAMGQFALQVVEAEVVQLIRYGIQAGGTAALGSLGFTSKQKSELILFAAGAAFLGGYLLGELKPIRRPILRATLDIYRGWIWTEVPPSQLGWSPAGGSE